MVEARPDDGGSGIGIDSDYWNWHTELSNKLQRFYDKFMETRDPPGPDGVPPGQKEAYADLSSYVERFRNATATEQFYDLLAPNKTIFTELESINPKIASTDAYKNSAGQRNHSTLAVSDALNNARGRLNGWEGTAKDNFGNEWLPAVENSLYEFAAAQAAIAACAELYRNLIKKTRQDVLSIVELAIEGQPIDAAEKGQLILTSVGYIVGIASTFASGGVSGAAMTGVLGSTLNLVSGTAASREENPIRITENDLIHNRRRDAISELDRLESETRKQSEMIQGVVKKIADALSGATVAESIYLPPWKPQVASGYADLDEYTNPDKWDDFKLHDKIDRVIYQ